MSAQKPEQIKYVIVELVRRKDVEEKDIQLNNVKVTKGHFGGVSNKMVGNYVSSFVTVVDEKTVSHSCNLEVYNILSVQVGFNNYVEYTFYLKDESEQKKAFEDLADILANLVELNMVADSDPDTVNISKYAGSPLTEKKETATSSTTKTATSNFPGYSTSGAGCSANRGQNYSGNTYTGWGADKKVLFCKRKTKKPTVDVLRTLRKKLKALQEGTYEDEVIDLPDKVGAVKTQGYQGHLGNEYYGEGAY